MPYVGKIIDDDGVTGLVGSTLYGTCATAAATVAKVVTLADFDELMTGITIHVKFTNVNTASSPTLNVNSTGAKAIYRNGAAAGSGAWQAGQVVSFTYTGSQWEINESGHVVVQSGSTTTNYRPIMLGYTNTTTIADLAATTINQVYANTSIFAQPSTGNIYANNLYTTSTLTGAGAALTTNGLNLKAYIAGTNATYSYARTVFRTYSGKIASNSGLLAAVDGGGLTIIGAGESANSLANLIDNDQSTDTEETPTAKLDVGGTLGTKLVGDSEQLLLSSDNNIYFITKCNTIAQRQPVVLDTSSQFYPGTNNTGSIGTSSLKWRNVYATTFYGDLNGTINTATTATTQTKGDNSTKVATTAFVRTAIGDYIPLAGSDAISGNLKMNATNLGYYLTDKTGFTYPGIRDNNRNMWIGAIDSSSQQHAGHVYIATGYDTENSKGFLTAYVYVPNATNTAGAATYQLLHDANLKAGTGLSFATSSSTAYTGTIWTINHSNSVTAGTAKGDDSKTLTFGGTFTIPSVTYDAQGHITAKGTTTMTMPADPRKYAFVYDNSSDFASYAWHKFAEVTISDANADATATFLVSQTWKNGDDPTPKTGILIAHIRTSSTKVFSSAHFKWLVAGDTIDPTEFVMVYTDTASTSCKVELWHKQIERYDGWVFKLLKEHSRMSYGNYPWKMYVYTASTHGLSAYTAGTGTVVSSLNTIANTVANADKINTDAGNANTPVYFSGGIPVAVTLPKSGAWWTSEPHINGSGVLEVGRYIDFHATNASTNNYDIRLDASSTSLLTLSSSSGTPAFRIAGTLPRLRFTQTTTGKDYDNAGVGIWCQPADTSGVNMFMQSHGNMMISSGEFCTNAYARKDATGQTQVGYDNIVGSTSENLYLGSDGEVQIISNGQNIATYSNNNHKVWTFGTDGTLTTPGSIKDSLDNQHTMIQQNLRSASNCVALTWWIVDGAASATTRPGIYYHNTGGDSTDKGAIILQPYHSSSNPWDSTHPIGLYIGKGILQLDGVNVSLEGHTHNSLTSKTLTKSTLDGTAGNFFFKGDNLLGSINDWVGIQADAGNDKFQLIANGASLMYRQNDTGGTNSTNWTDWVGLLSPSRVTTDTYLSVEATTSTVGSDTTAFTFNSGVKISHKAYTAYSSGLYKITVDAAGHVSAATALTITPTPASKTHTNFDTSAERAYLVTKGWVSYWNGAYNSSNASNLTYCNRGAFGTIVTKSDTDYVPNTTDGVNAAINLLTTGTSVPASDDDYYISQSAGGGTTTTTYHRRPIVKLWQYMVDRSVAFYYNGTAEFADAPWAKVVSLKCASASSYRHIAFLVSKVHYNSTDKYSWGILCVKFATNSSKNYDTTAGVGACEWLVAHGNIATTDFKFMYTNTGTTSTTVDIWCKAGHRYASYVFKVLNDTLRGLSGAAYIGTSNIELFSVNGAGVAETDVTGTEITQTLTTIANTSARANTVSGTLTNPTSATQYAIPFHSGTSTAAKTLRNNNGLQYKTLEGTADAEGYSALMLGNSTATGTAANKYGILRVYSKNTSYIDLIAASTTTARTQTLPSMAGTLCCLNKNSTSYWGLYDGDASGTQWLRTTQSGFIPYAAGAFTESNTSSIGTDTWWFNRAYIRTIQTGVIKFRSGNTESNTTRSYLQLQQGITGNYDWRLPPASGEIMVRKGSVTAGASQSVLYTGTTSGWGHQSVEVVNIFKNWSLIVVNFMSGGYGYSSTDKHSFNSVVPLDFVKSKGTTPSNPYFIPVPANGTNVDATELIECIYVDDSTIEFNRSGASGGIGKITIWGIY